MSTLKLLTKLQYPFQSFNFQEHEIPWWGFPTPSPSPPPHATHLSPIRSFPPSLVRSFLSIEGNYVTIISLPPSLLSLLSAQLETAAVGTRGNNCKQLGRPSVRCAAVCAACVPGNAGMSPVPQYSGPIRLLCRVSC